MQRSAPSTPSRPAPPRPAGTLPGAALFALLALGAAGDAPAAPRLTPAPCRFTVPDGERADCAVLEVPEHRARPGGRTLALPVAVLRSRAARPARDPVVFVEGGPGAAVFGTGAGMEERMEGWWDTTLPFRRRRDVVLFDARGSGLAEPDTDCPELDGLAAAAGSESPPTAERRVAMEADALDRCAARLRDAGVDLTAFSTAALADDLADLAAALGGEPVNLLAVSYGTRVALEALRRHGGRFRAVVLDGVYPPDVTVPEEQPAAAAAAFRRLFDDCTASRRCRAAFPDLERRVAALVARLDGAPVTVRPEEGMPPVRLDGATLLAAALEAMAGTEALARLPALLDRAARGRPEELAYYAPAPWLGDVETADGMAFAIECRETVNPADPARVEAARRRALPFGAAADTATPMRVCARWPAGTQEPGERLPVAGTVPVLLLSGAYDPFTPPSWGERAAATLPRSRHLLFRSAGHVVTAVDRCALDTVVAFIDTADPVGLRPCASAGTPPRFTAP
ncbi:alpha/beta fold hydrolase [Azospirillum halopraeferens]|uniref:alpha/beta fold hydrolase n=1 Tax=Azospirillum halopraeferens TaxID=34010 RepID=UPI0003FE1953|nr:alpha/beta fold hydrolase [Azospirillum halopraeferens]